MIVLNSVTILKNFWKGKKTINYKISKAPNSQNLPDDFYTITFGLNIISRKNDSIQKYCWKKTKIFFN